MKIKALSQVLTNSNKCTASGEAFTVNEDAALTIYANLGSETMMVSPVCKLEFSEDLVLATTQSRSGDEYLYAIVSEDVRAIVFGKQAPKRRSGLV